MKPRAGEAIACAILLGLAFWTAGCTRVGTTSTGGTAANGNAWTHHGLLRIVNLSEPDSLNPVVGNQQIDSDLAEFWGSQLLNWSDKNEFVPELATSVPTPGNGGISKDGKTIVYHLRRNVRWHDGAPFDAGDVIFTWHAIMNKKNNVPSTVGYDLIGGIDRRDAYTIAVHLRAPYAPFIGTFFAPSSTPFPILPRHLLAKYDNINQVPYNSQPIGTGPFIVDRWQRGSKIVFRANPNYWRGPPKLKAIWYTPVPDENTIVTLLQSHEADLEFHAASSNLKQLSNIAGFRVERTPFTEYGQLAFNVSGPILSDVRVRRALWTAIDIGGLIRDISHGVNLAAYTDQPAFLWAYNPKVARYDYSPLKAGALLDAAGWKRGSDGIRTKDGRRLSLVLAGVSGSAAGNAVNVIVQRDWHDAGVEANVKLYTSSLFFSSFGAGGIVQTGKFDAAFFAWINGVDPDNSTLWMCDQIPPNGQNVYRFCNPALDAAERIALTTYNRPARKRAYDTIQRIWADQVPAIIIWFTRRVSVANTDLKNFHPAHAVTSFWNPYEWDI